MARVTIEDVLEVIPNRFEIIDIAAKRAHELMQGAKTSLSDSEAKHKATVQALREIASGQINLSSEQESTEEQLLEELSKLDQLDEDESNF
ncbi:MAG: DNA-directed RNA polymerase subunit omega [Pseudomonadota bacterium]|nr:DNA-directed RNA polymerase subunit omega [Pseudomonadota bacterium]